MDQDGDGSVDRGEFLQKMLVRLGKCEMSDIDDILSQCVPLRSPLTSWLEFILPSQASILTRRDGKVELRFSHADLTSWMRTARAR